MIFRDFYYVGNIVFDISGISIKVSCENMWRSYFFSYARNISITSGMKKLVIDVSKGF